MTLPALRDDALTSTPDGFAVRLGLPWIRSLPLASVDSLTLAVDGETVDRFRVAVGERRIAPTGLSGERGWWFLQDRLALLATPVLRPGRHKILISFRLVIPYLQVSPDGPLTLPFQVERALMLDAPAVPSISRDVA